MDIQELKAELKKLSIVIDDRIERDKERLTNKSKLIMDLVDVGFKKIFETKYSYSINNRGKSYLTFIVSFRGRNVDIIEDHIVIIDKKEVPLSSIGKDFTLRSVRYNRVIGELRQRVKDLTAEIERKKI